MRRSMPLLAVLAAVAAGTCAAATPPPNVAVTVAAGDVEGSSLAIDPTDPARLAVGYSTGRSTATGSCLVARSDDGGRTWKTATIAGDAARPLPPDTTHCADPVVAFGSEGTLYGAYDVSRLGGPGRVYLTSSNDHGATFEPPTVLDPAPSGGGDFEPAIATGVSNSAVSVGFERYDAEFEDAAVLAATTDDGGRTVSDPVRVSPEGQNALNGRAAAAADRAGNVYLAWVDASDVDFAGSGSARLEVAVSRSRGATFGAPATIATVPSGCGPNDDCGNRCPAVALAAGARGVADLAWSAGNYPDPARVFVARSRDAGKRWTPPAPIGVPSGDGDRDQLRPSIVVAPDGRVDLGWADQARDADDRLLDVYFAYSLDGARTFSRPVRLDTTPSNTQRTPFVARIGIAASNGAAHAAWQDARVDRPPGSYVVFARVPDALPPRIPTVVGPRELRMARATYSLRSSDDFTPRHALRFRCGLDRAPLHACRARYTQGLSRGRHVFRVRALDGAGNPSPVRSIGVLVR